MINKKIKYMVYFISGASGVATVEKIKRIGVTTDIVSYDKDISHPLDIDKPTMLLKNMLIYIIDIKSGQISFEKSKTTIDVKMISKIVKQSIISQLTKSMDKKMAWLELIMGFAGGFGIGALIFYIVASGGYL